MDEVRDLTNVGSGPEMRWLRKYRFFIPRLSLTFLLWDNLRGLAA